MLWVPKGLVVGIVGFALEVRAESSSVLDFIRRSFFCPTHREDVDVASVVCCHFRQVCVSVNRVFVIVILCVACLFTWFYTKVSTVQRNSRCSSTRWFDLLFLIDHI